MTSESFIHGSMEPSTMKPRILRIAVSVTATLALAAIAAFAYQEIRDRDVVASRAPNSALIVETRIPINRELRARFVSDRHKLSSLESCFPNYHQRPSSNAAGGWISSYLVYFNFGGGESICVTVSYKEAALWTIGRGDLPVAGNFYQQVAELFPDDK